MMLGQGYHLSQLLQGKIQVMLHCVQLENIQLERGLPHGKLEVRKRSVECGEEKPFLLIWEKVAKLVWYGIGLNLP